MNTKPVLTGCVTHAEVDRIMKLYGGNRTGVLDMMVCEAVQDMRRRYPDLNMNTAMVDITDNPRAAGPAWCVHFGDHVPSAISAHWTRRYNATEFRVGEWE